LKAHLREGRADIVLSDMAAPTTGHTATDHLRIMGLAEQAYAIAVDVLTPGGPFLCKVFQGGSEDAGSCVTLAASFGDTPGCQ
jgi:23S rRNA (uridine2552-2'-O)-methyltransferase